MSNYHLKPIVPLSIASQEKKEQRRKVLEAVRARRRQLYKRFDERAKKALEQASGDMI